VVNEGGGRQLAVVVGQHSRCRELLGLENGRMTDVRGPDGWRLSFCDDSAFRFTRPAL